MDKMTIESHFRGDFIAFYDHFLPNIKRGGRNERKACCPFHDERNPSFFMNIETGLFKCFGCGAAGSIFDFYAKIHNMSLPSDFSKVLDSIAREFSINKGNGDKQTAKPVVTERYDYRDEIGNLVFQIERLVPKSFRIRRPDGNGGWIYKKDDARIVPYHLPEIQSASEIIICEGEKDADALASLGFISTTAPFGAGKWPDNFGQFFKGKFVTLIPDNDRVGIDHMRQVAENLQNHAASVKWLDLPNLPEKGDISDFIKTFSDKEEAAERLAIMLEGLASYEQPKDSPILQDVSASELCLPDTAIPENDPLIFPDVMSGVAGNFADIYSAHLESARHFFYMAFLTCLGNLIAGLVSLSSEVSSSARLFLLLLGESADDRKSTAIKKTISFFRDTIQDFVVCHGVGSAEGLAKILSDQPRVLLVFDEFKAFVSKSKIESSVLLPCVTTLFESDWYENVTIKRTLRIAGADLSMLAACTLETYETIFDQSFLAIGFPNRLFLCPGKSERKYAFPSKISDEDKYRLGKDLSEVLHHVTDHPEICITGEANDIYQNWYQSIPGSVHSKRIDTYALRLMQLLAINEKKTIIDKCILEKAIALSNWQLAVRRRYDPIDADSVMARMEEKIRRLLDHGSKSKRDLQRAVHANRVGTWYFDNALKNLLKSEEIIHNTKLNTYTAC